MFNWLRLAARLFPKDTPSHLLAKVFLDQTCFAPVGLSAFYVGLTAMEGKSVDAIYKEWREKFPNTWAVRKILEIINCETVSQIFMSLFELRTLLIQIKFRWAQ